MQRAMISTMRVYTHKEQINKNNKLSCLSLERSERPINPMLCKVCHSKQMAVKCLPCRHIYACFECAKNMNVQYVLKYFLPFYKNFYKQQAYYLQIQGLGQTISCSKGLQNIKIRFKCHINHLFSIHLFGNVVLDLISEMFYRHCAKNYLF